jgi:hypothetical protein
MSQSCKATCTCVRLGGRCLRNKGRRRGRKFETPRPRPAFTPVFRRYSLATAMATRTSGRHHRQVDYNEKSGSGSGAPAWARQIESAEAADGHQKENNQPPVTKQAHQRKSAPAVASKGRDAGLTRLPIGELESPLWRLSDARGNTRGCGVKWRVATLPCCCCCLLEVAAGPICGVVPHGELTMARLTWFFFSICLICRGCQGEQQQGSK